MGAQIKIRIDKKGDTFIEVNGVEGSACEQLTEKMMQALGETEEVKYKEEYEQILPDYLEVQE